MLKMDSPEEVIRTWWVIQPRTHSQNQQKPQCQELTLISQSKFITSETRPISLKALMLLYERSP